MIYQLRIVFRRLWLDKGFTGINFIGLFLGMVTSILILQYVLFEKGFDRFNERADNIYRLTLDFVSADESRVSYATNFPLVWQELKADFPEVKNAGKIEYAYGGNLFEYQDGDKRFVEEQTYWANQGFWDMFSYQLMMGDERSLLSQPNTAVISESTAVKYFGTADPMGKILTRNTTENFEVVGIFEDVPGNSHLQFDVLLSRAVEEVDEYSWRSWGSFTYIEVAPENIENLSTQLVHYLDKFVDSKSHTVELFPVLLSDVHFDQTTEEDETVKADARSINYLFYMALLVVLIAWINHTNLSISAALRRAKEAGIRKVLGSSKLHMAKLILLETFILHVVAIITALLTVYMIIPQLQFNFDLLIPQLTFSNALWTYLLIFLAAGLIISGLYPALMLSYIGAVDGLKGSLKAGKGSNLRRGIVVVQYASALVLLIVTLTVYQQIEFMRSAELGINRAHTLVVRSPSVRGDEIHQQLRILRDKLLVNTNVLAVATSSDVPGRMPRYDFGGIRTQTQAIGHQYKLVVADPDFADFYGLHFMAGRNFDEDFATDVNEVFINESAMRLLDINSPEEAIGQELYFPRANVHILGVVRDFHVSSVKDAIAPTVFHYRPPDYPFGRDQISIRVTGDLREAATLIEETYASVFPRDVFDFFYMDDYFEEQYQPDQTFGMLFGFFSIVAIVITVLGLLGLTTFSIIRRLKEVSIRKVLGASIQQLTYHLSREFLYLAMLASVVAIPAGYLFVKQWLESFAQRININGWLFIAPMLMLFVVTLLLVSSKTIKAAVSNPVDYLKQE